MQSARPSQGPVPAALRPSPVSERARWTDPAAPALRLPRHDEPGGRAALPCAATPSPRLRRSRERGRRLRTGASRSACRELLLTDLQTSLFWEDRGPHQPAAPSPAAHGVQPGGPSPPPPCSPRPPPGLPAPRRAPTPPARPPPQQLSPGSHRDSLLPDRDSQGEGFTSFFTQLQNSK